MAFATLIATDELAARLDAPGLVVLDVRHDLARPDWGEAQYRAGHVPGARFVHLDRDLSAPPTGRNGRHPLPTPEAAARMFGALGIDGGTQVVAYDQGNGVYAARAWWMLRWLGHEAVAVLDGGFARWTAEGRPVTTALPAVRAATLEPSVQPTVAAEGVRASLARRSLLLVDARAPERFRGETEPLDPVAGHIPGARNRPAGANVNGDGTFKSPEELRAGFEALLRGRSAADVVHYCGSGVTACHNALAMTIAGLGLARVYPGSWSEWVADPTRPVESGAEDDRAPPEGQRASAS
jgi:thiosulfate/3-mercaptopyruvate sulfurtransferase